MTFTKQLLHLGVALALTATLSAKAQESPEDLPKAAWFRQFQQELRAAWVAPNNATSGSIRFVVGNDRTQPGAAFKSGDAWLALVCGTTECHLAPATLSVAPQRAGQQLHFEVTDAADVRTVAWFAVDRAQPWLTSGAIATYYSGDGHPKETDKGTEEAQISLPGGSSAVLMPMLLSNSDFSTSPPVLLMLRIGNRRQLLLGQLGLCGHSFRSDDYLLWAGDLDHDGKPDFLVSFVDGDGPIHLYLSSTAKSQRQVGLAGIYNPPPSGINCDASGEGEQTP